MWMTLSVYSSGNVEADNEAVEDLVDIEVYRVAVGLHKFVSLVLLVCVFIHGVDK